MFSWEVPEIFKKSYCNVLEQWLSFLVNDLRSIMCLNEDAPMINTEYIDSNQRYLLENKNEFEAEKKLSENLCANLRWNNAKHSGTRRHYGGAMR